MLKQAYKSYRMIENIKMLCVGLGVCILLFLPLCLHLYCLPYIFVVLNMCSCFVYLNLN